MCVTITLCYTQHSLIHTHSYVCTSTHSTYSIHSTYSTYSTHSIHSMCVRTSTYRTASSNVHTSTKGTTGTPTIIGDLLDSAIASSLVNTYIILKNFKKFQNKIFFRRAAAFALPMECFNLLIPKEKEFLTALRIRDTLGKGGRLF